MPLYEYLCDNCNTKFDRLIRGANKEPVMCPKCGKSARRLMTTLMKSGKGSQCCETCAPSPSACSRCGIKSAS
ncbi:MAG: zinc ribbon domain-containing protein [bacterium]